MKQNINIKQLNELSEKGKERFVECFQKDSSKGMKRIILYSPLLSIGQMIEFLDENKYIEIKKVQPGTHWQWLIIKNEKQIGITSDQSNNYELCDALWEAVKEILEKE